MTARFTALLFALVVTAQADTLILKDGTKVTGRWWSIDANQVHFLVNNQLKHYARADVSAVTFGDATLPPPPTPPTAQAPGSPAPTATTASGRPTLARPAPASAPPPAPAPAPAPAAPAAAPTPAPDTPPTTATAPFPASPPSLAHPTRSGGNSAPAASPAPAAPAPASEPSGGISEPSEIGMVYFQNSPGNLIPLERNQAVQRNRGRAQVWEMPGARSRVRVKSAASLVFVVRLGQGVDPNTYSLFPMVTANNTRRTEPEPGRQGVPVTMPFEISKTSDTTYTFTVKDLATGEYSFSPSSSNDGFCFGVDEGGR